MQDKKLAKYFEPLLKVRARNRLKSPPSKVKITDRSNAVLLLWLAVIIIIDVSFVLCMQIILSSDHLFGNSRSRG